MATPQAPASSHPNSGDELPSLIHAVLDKIYVKTLIPMSSESDELKKKFQGELKDIQNIIMQGDLTATVSRLIKNVSVLENEQFIMTIATVLIVLKALIQSPKVPEAFKSSLKTWLGIFQSKFVLELTATIFDVSDSIPVDCFRDVKTQGTSISDKQNSRNIYASLMQHLDEESRGLKASLASRKPPLGPPGPQPRKPLELVHDIVVAALTLKGQQYVRAGLMILSFVRVLGNALSESDQKALNDRLVGIIYTTMPHPPQIVKGYDFRSADGSDDLGRADRPYAINVSKEKISAQVDASARRLQTQDTARQSTLPPAKDVFEQLMMRRKTDKFVPSRDNLSALTFAFGSLVIHSVFNSDLTDPLVNKASSYFDLSPLYGNSQEAQDKMRNKNGRGYILDDCFSDTRMLSLPPAAGALLLLFNRNHNYIATEIYNNCRGARGWTDPDSRELELNPTKRARQDEEIFQTARLVNCKHFVNIVVTDYVGGLMGKTQTFGGWPYTAEPFGEIRQPDMAVGRGDGNLVSLEFNTLYRWHASLSENEIKWAETTLDNLIGKHDNLLPQDFVKLQAAARAPSLDPPQARVFNEALKRDSNGRYADKDIAAILLDATDSPAGQFRARGSPEVLSWVDIKGIQAARQAGLCTLNEFRDFLGLRRFTSFKDWNADPDIAEAAKKLYGDIDNLELYPGLHGEGNPSDGTGQYYSTFNRIHTMRNGLLFDAVTLIRSDRFFTTAWNATNASEWGYNDTERDFNNKAFGGSVYKILMRTLPGQFPDNNIYTYFPMSTPQSMKALLATSGQKWETERPKLNADNRRFYDSLDRTFNQADASQPREIKV